MKRKPKTSLSSSLRHPHRTKTSSPDNLARLQALASIGASIAIPIILAIVGYYVQRQLSEAGIRKDYVQIATNILKDDPKGQEPDLRKWAVTVLDKNSDVPFSQKAKNSLESGLPIVVSRFIFPNPPATCMHPPGKTYMDKWVKENAKKKIIEVDADDFVKKMITDWGTNSNNAASLHCLQEWIAGVKKITDDTNNSLNQEVGKTGSADIASDATVLGTPKIEQPKQ